MGSEGGAPRRSRATAPDEGSGQSLYKVNTFASLTLTVNFACIFTHNVLFGTSVDLAIHCTYRCQRRTAHVHPLVILDWTLLICDNGYDDYSRKHC